MELLVLFLYALVEAFLLAVLKIFGADASILVTWGAILAIPFFLYAYSIFEKAIGRKNRRRGRVKKSEKTSTLKKAA